MPCCEGMYDPRELVYLHNDAIYSKWGKNILFPMRGALQKINEKH